MTSWKEKLKREIQFSYKQGSVSNIVWLPMSAMFIRVGNACNVSFGQNQDSSFILWLIEILWMVSISSPYKIYPLHHQIFPITQRVTEGRREEEIFFTNQFYFPPNSVQFKVPHQKYSGGADSLKVPGPDRAQVGKLGGQGDILIPFSSSFCSTFSSSSSFSFILHSSLALLALQAEGTNCNSNVHWAGNNEIFSCEEWFGESKHNRKCSAVKWSSIQIGMVRVS